MIDKRLRPTKLLWVDLEMTGLDSASDVILEVAAIITDFSFSPLAQYETAIRHSEAILARSNEWSRAQHEASGLLGRVRSDGKSEDVVRRELIKLIQKHFGSEPAILAGNSIHQDRNFIRSWWPDVEALLHYRMMDVSSLKVYMQGKHGIEFKKTETHRALDDIQESISEWQYYLEYLSSTSR